MTARHIREMYWGDLPMGLIQSAWGGTRVEAWAPPDVNARCEPNPPADPKPQENPRYSGGGAWITSACDLTAVCSALYNGMIAPLTKFAIRGALWFQARALAIYPRHWA